MNAESNPKPTTPEHPMMLSAQGVPGDPALMARCMLEEMLRAGIAPAELAEMTRNPFYGALHHAREALGDEAMDALFEETLGRTGHHHHRVEETGGHSAATSLTIGATETPHAD